MKIRQDFITNSSSSSFLVALKDPKIKPEKLVETVFKVQKDSPFYTIAFDMAKELLDAEEITLEEMLERYGENDISELPERYQKIFKSGLMVLQGRASNDGDPVEAMLCDMDLDYESEDFIIYKNGGY